MITDFLDVACAVIVNSEGKFLCAKRGKRMLNAGKWEFPGGKLEKGENVEACIRREIREEMGVDLTVHALGPCFISVHGTDRLLRLHVLWCEIRGGTPTLAEHEAIAWLCPNEMRVLDWQFADIPIVEWLLTRDAKST